MKTYSVWTALMAGSLLLLAACTPTTPPTPQEGEIDRNLPHVLKPVNQQVYEVHNLKKEGEKVFLFPTDEALASCYQAVEAGIGVEEHCSAVEAAIEDGTPVRALECNTSKYAVCTIQVMTGEASGVKGALMWDWLKPQEP